MITAAKNQTIININLQKTPTDEFRRTWATAIENSKNAVKDGFQASDIAVFANEILKVLGTLEDYKAASTQEKTNKALSIFAEVMKVVLEETGAEDWKQHIPAVELGLRTAILATSALFPTNNGSTAPAQNAGDDCCTRFWSCSC